MSTAKTLSERIVKLEVEIDNLQDDIKDQLHTLNLRLSDITTASNHEHTKIYDIINNQQSQIDKILSQCLSHQLESEKIKITNKVIYVIGGALTIGIITLAFDIIKKLMGI